MRMASAWQKVRSVQRKALSATGSLNVFVHQYLCRFYEGHAAVVARFPWWFVSVPLVLSVVLGSGFHQIRIENDVNVLYNPENSPAPNETRINEEFYYWQPPSESDDAHGRGQRRRRTEPLLNTYLTTIINHRSYGNVLCAETCAMVKDTQRFFVEMVKRDFKQHSGLRDLIDSTVATVENLNLPLLRFCDMFFTDGLQMNPNFRFTFPFMEVFGMKINLENGLGGVEEYRNGTLKAAKILKLSFFAFYRPGLERRKDAIFDALDDYLKRRLAGTNFSHVFMNTELFNEDIRKNTSGSLPYFAVSVVLVTLFILVSTADKDPVRSKSLEGILGSLCSIMAVVSAFGLLCYLHVPFNPLVSVTPFMALAIGMDDTFLTINAWQQTDPRLSPKERLQKTISESASAVTVTSLTDIALFSIGTMTDTLAIKGFSIFTAVTMVFDFLYQVTFFAGVMLLSGRREHNNKNDLLCVCRSRRRSQGQNDSPDDHRDGAVAATIKPRFSSSSASSSSLTMDVLFADYYAPILNNRWARRLSVVAFIVYLLLSFWGCCRLQVDMNVSMLLVDDSPLKPYFHYKYNFERSVVTVTVHVQRPPDLTSEEEINEFMSLVTVLESNKFSRGADTSLLWLKDYLRFIETDTNRSEDPYERFEEFLRTFQYQTYASDIRWYKNNSGRVVIGRFQFQSYYNTSGHWSKMTNLLQELRLKIKKYDKYGVSIFIPDNAMWDLVIGCPDNTLQTVGVGIFCMIFMSAFFIPNYNSVLWVSLTLASMDLGVIGFLSLWGVTLNPVSVINIIMSLDFPVEYATHICHCYYKLQEADPDIRIRLTLGKVGWSILQGGLTALAAAVPLGLVRSYMIRIFFRTILLVVSIGMLHALLWLPIFLAATSRRNSEKISEKRMSKAR